VMLDIVNTGGGSIESPKKRRFCRQKRSLLLVGASKQLVHKLATNLLNFARGGV
jgi:shikimate kinase